MGSILSVSANVKQDIAPLGWSIFYRLPMPSLVAKYFFCRTRSFPCCGIEERNTTNILANISQPNALFDECRCHNSIV